MVFLLAQNGLQSLPIWAALLLKMQKKEIHSGARTPRLRSTTCRPKPHLEETMLPRLICAFSGWGDSMSLGTIPGYRVRLSVDCSM